MSISIVEYQPSKYDGALQNLYPSFCSHVLWLSVFKSLIYLLFVGKCWLIN